MSEVKLIISEIDGVLTDGTLPMDELGNVPFKKFYMEDFEAVNALKRRYTVVFLSSDNRINYHLCRGKNIPFFWAKKDKYREFLNILRRYNVTADEVVYVGSRLSDLQCIKTVPTAFCPNRNFLSLQKNCTQLEVSGGQGVLTELYIKYFS